MKRIISACLALLAMSAVLHAKIYTATDKNCYVAGETVYCSVFSSDADAVAYLSLLNSAVPETTAKIALDNGRGGGMFTIPYTCPTGNYSLVTYTASGSVDTRVLSIFNTFSTIRVPSGVTVSDRTSPVQRVMNSAYGLVLSSPSDSLLILENSSKMPVTACLSVCLADNIPSPQSHTVFPIDLPAGGQRAAETDGETVRAKVCGPDAGKVNADVTAILAVPGSKTDVYTAFTGEDGRVVFHTENIYGDVNVVCMLQGLPDNAVCHLELDLPKTPSSVYSIPSLVLSSDYASALIARREALAGELACSDTLASSLPVRHPHFFMEHEPVSYVLDDYTRFPTMEEVFVEIIKDVRVHKSAGEYVIKVMTRDDALNVAPVWGNSLVLLDGVPVVNHEKIWNYDPALVKTIEIYPYSYSLGDKTYGGVMNFVTYKSNLAMMAFDDNVRIYDFKGCSFPMMHRDRHTLYWNPLITLSPGESVSVDLTSFPLPFNAVAEGMTSDGKAVRSSFARQNADSAYKK